MARRRSGKPAPESTTGRGYKSKGSPPPSHPAITGPDEVVYTDDRPLNQPITTDASQTPTSNVPLEAHGGSYRLREGDLLDPGWVLFVGLREEITRQLASARDAARAQALRELEDWAFGLPARSLPGTTFIRWIGPAGEAVPPETVASSQDASIRARVLEPQGIRLSSVRAAHAHTADQRQLDLLPWLNGEDDNYRAPMDSLVAIRFGLQRVTKLGESAWPDFPGMLWKIPSTTASQVRDVRAIGNVNGQQLRWELDPMCRLYIPPQRVEECAEARHGQEGELCWVEITAAFDTGVLPHAGRPLLNVTRVECEDPYCVFPIPPRTLRAELGKAARLVRGEQPFEGACGIREESQDAWRKRIAAANRYGEHPESEDDYRHAVESSCPDMRVLDVAATRVRVNRLYKDAVRLTLIPREWGSLPEMFDRAYVAGRRTAELLTGRTVLGVQVIAGPPTVRVSEPPKPESPLWPYLPWITVSSDDTAFREDGVRWPVYQDADLRAHEQRTE